MTTWTEQVKTGVTEVPDYLTLSTADADILLTNTSGDMLALSRSVVLSGQTTWTDQTKT
jgi:hypothetical protein